jgi:hypothetical protein
MEEKLKELETNIERLESLSNENEELKGRVKELEYKLEKHKHSGKETSDISNILSERLGLKMGTFTSMTGAEGLYFDFANILVSIGNPSFGKTRVNSIDDKYFGIDWNTVGGQYFTTNAPFVLPFFSSDPDTINGSIYYNTTTHRVRVCQNGTFVDMWTD